MLDKLRDQLTAFLSQHQTGVLSALTASPVGAWAVPVLYRASGLQVECLVPRWSEVAFYLEENSRVVLTVAGDGPGQPRRWLTYQGSARPLETTTLEPQLDRQYRAVLLQPERLDLVDERRGWGARETLEIS